MTHTRTDPYARCGVWKLAIEGKRRSFALSGRPLKGLPGKCERTLFFVLAPFAVFDPCSVCGGRPAETGA